MAARVIDGKAVAARVREEVRAEVAGMRRRRRGLATILVGDDPASAVYVRMKREDSAEVGIESFHHEPGGDVSQEELAALIASLNADERVHGILLQLPLPGHLDQDPLIAAIDPAKDVDGLTPLSAGLLAQDRPGAFAPCTPSGVIELLREAGVELEGARAVVIGRSILVGKPLAALLLAANATVTHCHSRTRDLGAVCREADVLIAAAGKPGLLDGRDGPRGGDGDRRRHEQGRGQAGRRRRLRLGQRAGRGDHAGARRGRPDDAGDAARQHARRRPRAPVGSWPWKRTS